MPDAEIDSGWKFVLACRDEHIRMIAMRAAQEPALRELFPYISMRNLRFSRSSGYPFDPMPYIQSGADENSFEARGADHAPLGKGDLDTVVLLVAAAIVRDHTPERSG